MPKVNHNKSNPISLFSFQDIITSVTGIMILIVLLLILSILDKKLMDEPVQADSESELSVRVELSRELAQFTETLQQEKEKLSKLNIITTDFEKQSLRDLMAIEEKAERTQKENIKALFLMKKEYTEKIKILERLSTEKETLTGQGKNIVNNKNKTKSMLNSIAKYKAKITKIKAEKNRVFFAVSRRERKKPILVQCSVAGIQINILDEEALQHIKDDSDNYLGIISKFHEWLKTRNNKKDYIILLLKPSSAGFSTDLEFALKNNDFEYGMEPLEEEKTGVF